MSYVNEKSVLAIGILFIPLGIITVASRFYVRYIQRKIALGADDWLCLPALAFTIGGCSIMIIGAATKSIGNHSPPIGPAIVTYTGPDLVLQNKLKISFFLISLAALAFMKTSILFFYRRLFRGKLFNVVSWTLIGLVTIWAVVFIISILAQCGGDIYGNFGSLAGLQMKCDNTFADLIAMAVADVAMDLAILILPIPLVLRLRLPLRHKLSILANLFIGALAIACGITRLVFFAEILGPALLSKPSVAGLPATDNNGVVSVVLFWSQLELGIGMVAICLPTLRPLFHGWSPESIISNIRSLLTLRSRTDSLDHQQVPLSTFKTRSRKEMLRGPSAPGKTEVTGADDEFGVHSVAHSAYNAQNASSTDTAADTAVVQISHDSMGDEIFICRELTQRVDHVVQKEDGNKGV